MANKTDLEKEIEHRLRAGGSVRKIATDLNLSRSDVQRRADQLKKSGFARLWIGGFVVAVVLVIVLVWFLRPKSQDPVHQAQQQSTNVEKPWPKSFRAVGKQILATVPDDKWLVETEQNPLTISEVTRLIGLGKRIIEQIEFGLQRNSSIPEVEKLRKIFSKRLFVTHFSNFGGGTSKFLTMDKEQAIPPDPTDQEVVIYGQFAQNHPHIRGQLLFYEQSWRSVMIGAIEWDQAWLEAVSLHELYHARMYREGAPSATAPQMSDLYIQEEVAAHNLEHDVLNLRTGGTYNATIQKILNSKVDVTSREALMTQITADDLKQLNGLFPPAGSREIAVRLAQFYISLLNGWVDRNFKDEELLQQKIVNYRKLVSTAR